MTHHWSTFGWLAAVFGCGAIDAAAWAIIAGAFGLTCMRAEHQDDLVEKHAATFGRLQTWTLFFGVTFAGNAVACAVAFLVGQALAAIAALVARRIDGGAGTLSAEAAMNATEFERSLTQLMAEAMPYAAPLNPARKPDDDLAATMMAELVNALAMAISFTARGDPKAIDTLLEGATERLYDAAAHHAGIQGKLMKAIRPRPKA